MTDQNNTLYYKIIYNGKEINNLSYEQLLAYNSKFIELISKVYYPINKIGEKSSYLSDIILYTVDVVMTSEGYIGNYTTLTDMYGVNALNENDKKIIEMFN